MSINLYPEKIYAKFPGPNLKELADPEERRAAE